jgi:hypothetical protein
MGTFVSTVAQALIGSPLGPTTLFGSLWVQTYVSYSQSAANAGSITATAQASENVGEYLPYAGPNGQVALQISEGGGPYTVDADTVVGFYTGTDTSLTALVSCAPLITTTAANATVQLICAPTSSLPLMLSPGAGGSASSTCRITFELISP